MVAGIIVTAGADELTIAHPGGHTSAATTAVILGGPALFLAGHVLFKWILFQHLSVPRLLAIAALAALVPVSLAVSPLPLAIATTLIVVAVAAADTIGYQRTITPVP